MGSISKKHEWEALAQLDPLWAILSDEQKRYRKWDLDEFFKTGLREAEGVYAQLAKRKVDKGSLLDFGCGVGRVSRGFLKFFDEVVGVDVSQTMIAKAKELHAQVAHLHFAVSNEKDLSLFPKERFNVIYSSIVLQHIPRKDIIRFLAEFARILKPNGVLVFQLPSYIPLVNRIQLRSRLFRFLARLGFSEKFLYEKLNLYPIRMNFISQQEVTSWLQGFGLKVEEVVSDSGPSGHRSSLYFCRR